MAGRIERKALADSIVRAERAEGVRGLIESFESRQEKSRDASEEAGRIAVPGLKPNQKWRARKTTFSGS